MLIDACQLEDRSVCQADVCVIGAGAAGLTLARRLNGRNIRVAVIESGGLRVERKTQSLCRAAEPGVALSLDEKRLRMFGGTTATWTGWCRPFDEIDFESRPWVSDSGWPIARSDLLPFYNQAQAVCQLGPCRYDAERWATPERPQLPLEGGRVVTKIFQLSPPVRFGRVYRGEIERSRNVTVYLHATAVELEADEAASRVTSVRVAAPGGRVVSVQAGNFVLAGGGIENARLLLLSNGVEKAGLGNSHDLVGRYFMEHPYFYSATFLPADPGLCLDLYSPHAIGETHGSARLSGFLGLAPEVLRRERMVSCISFFAPSYKAHPDFSSAGMRSLMRVLERVRLGSLPADLPAHLGSCVLDLHKIARTSLRKLAESYRRPRRRRQLRTFVEAAPNRESRVSLSNQRDGLGLNRAEVDWRLSAIDDRSVRRHHEILCEEIARAGLGRVEFDLDGCSMSTLPSVAGAGHHMGTTRMHEDPREGVVDSDCRVHGVANLFVAGSSVFPTSGSANPTLTIVALALRLADHLILRIMG